MEDIFNYVRKPTTRKFLSHDNIVDDLQLRESIAKNNIFVNGLNGPYFVSPYASLNKEIASLIRWKYLYRVKRGQYHSRYLANNNRVKYLLAAMLHFPCCYLSTEVVLLKYGLISYDTFKLVQLRNAPKDSKGKRKATGNNFKIEGDNYFRRILKQPLRYEGTGFSDQLISMTNHVSLKYIRRFSYLGMDYSFSRINSKLYFGYKLMQASKDNNHIGGDYHSHSKKITTMYDPETAQIQNLANFNTYYFEADPEKALLDSIYLKRLTHTEEITWKKYGENGWKFNQKKYALYAAHYPDWVRNVSID